MRDDGTTYVKVPFDTYATFDFYMEGCVPLVVDDMDVEQAETFRIEWGMEGTNENGDTMVVTAGTETIEIRDNDHGSRKGTHTRTHALASAPGSHKLCMVMVKREPGQQCMHMHENLKEYDHLWMSHVC